MRKRLYSRLLLSVLLLALAVLTSFPATSEACVHKWNCYASCDQSISDCSGGGDSCFEYWLACREVCDGFIC